ncbi:MAG: ABC transporter ATP-binding protein [bacterium]|nr:ABC transporter ATP-binding protein [bacterium]
MDSVIEVKQVSKYFGKKVALNNVNLSLCNSESLTLFGPNGAGKSTLLKIMSTLLHPSAGDVTICGISIHDDKPSIRKYIGIISHDSFLYGNLTAEENLFFYGKLYGVKNLKNRVDELLEKFNLTIHRDTLVRTFSRGMSQRLAIARAIIHDPAIIFLDEPYTGLDPQASDSLTNILFGFHQDKKTMIITTHDLEKGWTTATKIAILACGEIRLLEDKSNIKKENISEIYLNCIKTK